MYHFRMHWTTTTATREKMRDSDDAFGLWRAHLFAQTYYTIQKKLHSTIIVFGISCCWRWRWCCCRLFSLHTCSVFFTLCLCVDFFSRFSTECLIRKSSVLSVVLNCLRRYGNFSWFQMVAILGDSCLLLLSLPLLLLNFLLFFVSIIFLVL